jgi:hypothetical protein
MEHPVFTEDEIVRLYGYGEKNKKEVFVHIDPSGGGYTKTQVVAMILDNVQYIVVKEGCNPPFGKFLSELREMFPVANILIDVEGFNTAIGRGVVHAIVTLELKGVEFIIRNNNKPIIAYDPKAHMVTCFRYALRDGRLRFHKCLGDIYPNTIIEQLRAYRMKTVGRKTAYSGKGKTGGGGDDELTALMSCFIQFDQHRYGFNELREEE